MEQSTARKIVRIISVLTFIGTILAVFDGIRIIISGDTPVGSISLFMGILPAIIGYGLWHFKNWARLTIILLLCVLILHISFSLFILIGGTLWSGLHKWYGTDYLIYITQLIIYSISIWILAFKKDIIRLFKTKRI